MLTLREVYQRLLELYGPQGWWPLGGVYRPGDYSRPRSPSEVFEIYLGAVLTQNSTWSGTLESLNRLKALDALSPEGVLALRDEEFFQAIRPSRYFKQKSGYLRGLSLFFRSLAGRVPTRDELLAVRGVGQETADTLLLYAHRQLSFVIDAYTRRVLAGLGLADGSESYERLRELFQTQLPEDLVVYNEFHALLVAHAKKFYSKKPYGLDDPLLASR